MDKDQLFRNEFRVTPGLNGSFIIWTAPQNLGEAHGLLAFTDLRDLIEYMDACANAQLNEKQPSYVVVEGKRP